MAERNTLEFEEAERRLFARFGLEVESRFLELPDPKLRARVIEIGSGEPVVLVHGAGLQAAIWAPLMAELRGFRLIAVDSPGCGLTDPFLYTGVDLRRHAVSFLSSLLDALGIERAPLVGHSLGGLWSLRLAAERPERVSSLVLQGAPPILDMRGPFPFRLLGVPGLNRLLFALKPPSVKQARKLVPQFLGPGAAANMEPEYINVWYRSDELPGAGAAFRTLLERMIRLRGPRPGVRFDEDDFARVTQPTLFIWGESDVFGGPEYGRRASAAMPNARLEVTPGGHSPGGTTPSAAESSSPRSSAGRRSLRERSGPR
jgi:pimeloyl-ACP methyl ester carboxylesterase